MPKMQVKITPEQFFEYIENTGTSSGWQIWDDCAPSLNHQNKELNLEIRVTKEEGFFTAQCMTLNDFNPSSWFSFTIHIATGDFYYQEDDLKTPAFLQSIEKYFLYKKLDAKLKQQQSKQRKKI